MEIVMEVITSYNEKDLTTAIVKAALELPGVIAVVEVSVGELA